MKYKWILFDADGTLFDYEIAEQLAFELTFKELVGAPFLPEYRASYNSINKGLWLEFEKGTLSALQLRTRRFELLFRDLKMVVDAGTYSTRYLEHLSQSTDLLDGALEVVRALYPHYKLALITNGLREVQRSRFDRSTIRSYIAEITISDEVGAAKPDPAIFDVAFRSMGFPQKQEVLMVGDSLSSDIAGGVGYGIDTCWFNPTGLPRPDSLPVTYEIKRLEELLELLT